MYISCTQPNDILSWWQSLWEWWKYVFLILINGSRKCYVAIELIEANELILVKVATKNLRFVAVDVLNMGLRVVIAVVLFMVLGNLIQLIY